MPRSPRASSPPLEQLVTSLGMPEDPILSHREGSLVLPENIICFHHESAETLNQPKHGRALHHRLVLMFALETSVTVCVDDRAVRLHEGEGLLVLPFQFHHYIDAERDDLLWFFATFEVDDPSELESLRYRPFAVTPELRALSTQLIKTYNEPGQADILTLTLGMMLARIRRLKPARTAPAPQPSAPSIVTKVNLLAQSTDESFRLREVAAALGISMGHLRARFRASCGISLGKHLRRMRLEKACSLLRRTRDPVSTVAQKCGFSSVYAFSRSFRTTYGVSPLRYRRGETTSVELAGGAR